MAVTKSAHEIVIVGASYVGIQVAHYILKHIIPALPKNTYHLTLIDRSTHFFARIGAPRGIVSEDELPLDKVFFPIEDGFKAYPKEQFSFVQATATALDTTSRTINLDLPNGTKSSKSYYALIIATGSSPRTPLLGLTGPHTYSVEAFKAFRDAIPKAKHIVIAGGGPAGVEAAGEIGNFLNGKPGFFSTPPVKTKITLVTSADRILPVLRPSLGKKAEAMAAKHGVEVVYNTKVVSTDPPNAGQVDYNAADVSKAIAPVLARTKVQLNNGESIDADLFIPAIGTPPNTSWLPKNLLSSGGFLETNKQTLRVDAAGPRVYAIGDVTDFGRGGMLEVMYGFPVAMNNIKRDLVFYDSAPVEKRNAPAAVKDAVLTFKDSESQAVPIGHSGGVGAFFGWNVPSFAVWLLKGRDYMSGQVPGMLVGERQAKESVIKD